MNPLLTLITDHNPCWVGTQWPETPPPITLIMPSLRITNSLEGRFSLDLDATLETIMAGSPLMEEITQEAAGILQRAVVQASVAVAHHALTPQTEACDWKGTSFQE
jgi:hypothetical protein